MASRGSKKRKKKRKSRLWSLLWVVFTVISGGGVGGYLNPDIPVLGPLVQSAKTQVTSLVQSNEKLQGLGQALQGHGIPTGTAGGTNAAVPMQQASFQRTPDKIRIASFNIQVFGQSKLAKPDAMSVIVQCIRQFDIVAIQEVRAKGDNVLPDLVKQLNADGSRFSYLIGPRLGRTVSTEQYAFVFDTNRIEYDPSSIATMNDPADLLHREPFAARFRVRTNSPAQAFTFYLVNIHTDPDEVKQEVNALGDAYQAILSSSPAEDDVILLGDLNANEKQLGKLAQIKGMHWVVSGGVMTNTRQNKAYDNILFYGPATTEFTGNWGVLNFEQLFQLTRDQALKVSDHFPVWAEFQIWEAPKQGIFAERTGSRH